jgi:hypothetical protein
MITACESIENPSQTMNTCRTLVFAALMLASGIALAQLSPVEAPPTVRQMTNSPVEQYRVIDTSLIPVKNIKDGATALENALNELGAQGWRVRSGAGNFLVLAR